MTLEELKKHVRPLAWKKEYDTGSSFIPINCIDERVFIFQNANGTWYSYADEQNYPTKEEAMQSVEEYHLRELAKYFDLEDENEQQQS